MKIKASNKNEWIYFDEIFYTMVSKYTWSVGSQGYARANIKGNVTRMHKFLFCPILNNVVDHINGNKLDNRSSNIRIVKQAQNVLNKGRQKNNKSGYKGVWMDKSIMKWYVMPCYMGKRYYVGHFSCKHCAARAYNVKVQELHGEFAHLNEAQPCDC